MIELTIAKGIRPLHTTRTHDIEQWCRDYERNNKYPADIMTRFNIATYQIHQGVKWKDMGLNKYESYGAAFLHYMMLCVRMDLKFDRLPTWEPYCDITLWPKSYYEKEAPKLLEHISEATQQIFYGQKVYDKGYTRKSRYSPERLGRSMSKILEQVMSLIPVEHRQTSLYQASLIMTGNL